MQNALCILLLVITSSAVFAQGIGPVTFRDSLVMRQMIYRTPCPDPVPPAWSSVDSTLGRRPRCAIVETAAQALLPWANSDPRRAIDPWNPLCVRVVVANNTGSTGLPGDWMVIFDLSSDSRARIVIDRQSGAVASIQTSRGPVAVGDQQPTCLPE